MSLSVPTVVATAAELMPPGPQAPAEDIAALVGQLRDAADTAGDLVLDVMRLPASVEDGARQQLALGRVRIVDRLGWVRANALMLDGLLAGSGPDPLSGPSTRSLAPTTTRSLSRSLSRPLVVLRQRAERTGASVELGVALSAVGGRVLGQFDPFAPPHGSLLLVAPSILSAQIALGADPRDFRLWVALHERTHHVQFAAAPWMREHLRGLIAEVMEPLLGDSGASLRQTLAALPEAVRSRGSLLDTFAGPQLSAQIERLSALMSLLEGHADVVMDAVGPRVIPSVRTIRAAFNARRHADTGIRAVVAALLGVEEKMQQYERGAAFVRTIVAARGHAGLSPVWAGPEALPTPEEIASPRLWLRRQDRGA